MHASPEPGPGSYNDSHKEFGKQLSKVTIGVKRELRKPEGPGPGSYSPEKADTHTKRATSGVDFQKKLGRSMS